MGKFVKGDIVVIPFPFSDLSGSKRRPALVIAMYFIARWLAKETEKGTMQVV